MALFRIVRADPVSSKNVTGTPLIVAAIEKEELGLTIDIIGLNLHISALTDSLGGRASTPREASFPDLKTSSLVVHNLLQNGPLVHIYNTQQLSDYEAQCLVFLFVL